MSQEHPNILYVGSPDQGEALLAAVEPDDWYVYLPTEMLETLAMYVTYSPDVTVIDLSNGSKVAAAVYRHLRSIDASPMLVLTDEVMPDAYTLASNSTTSDIIEAVREITQGEPELMP